MMYTLKPKSGNMFMRLIGKFNKPFIEQYWTTVGNTIYYPTYVSNPHEIKYLRVIQHEMVHIKQYEKYTVPLFLFLYIFMPLPAFFSYFRWKFEREAYMTEIKYGVPVDAIVNALWDGYIRPWPKSWMKKWFEEQIKKERI